MRQDFIGLYKTCLELDLVELGKTDLSIYPLVFNEDILQDNLPYYHAYYHKKTRRQFR